MAPRLAVASIAIMVSGKFGRKAATRSPGSMPAWLSAWLNFETEAWSSRCDTSRATWSSP